MEQNLKDYSWDLGEYTLRASQSERGKLTLHDALNAYQLKPAPPASPDGKKDDYICLAQQTHELKYIFFYLHENEAYFNNRIETFLTAEGGWIHPERFMDLKLECRIEVLRRFQDYDPGKNAKFTTYIHRYTTDVMLRFRMEEEYGSFDSLQEYKDARQIMQLYTACHGNAEETIRLFADKNQCSEETAAEKLTAAWRQRNCRVPVLLNDEGEGWEQADELIPDHWDYVDILWAGTEADMVDKAFNKLSFRDQMLLEKRNAICMTCGRVSDMKTQVSFQKLAENYEGTGAPGAEKAYKRAVENLMLELVKLGQLHCVRLKQISTQHEGKKITAAAYSYQVDNDGAWGEIQFDLKKGTAWVETFAENDLCDTWEITDAAIRAVLDDNTGKLPRKQIIPIKHLKSPNS